MMRSHCTMMTLHTAAKSNATGLLYIINMISNCFLLKFNFGYFFLFASQTTFCGYIICNLCYKILSKKLRLLSKWKKNCLNECQTLYCLIEYQTSRFSWTKKKRTTNSALTCLWLWFYIKRVYFFFVYTHSGWSVGVQCWQPVRSEEASIYYRCDYKFTRK